MQNLNHFVHAHTRPNFAQERSDSVKRGCGVRTIDGFLSLCMLEKERECVCFVVGRDIGLNANPKVEEGKRAF